MGSGAATALAKALGQEPRVKQAENAKTFSQHLAVHFPSLSVYNTNHSESLVLLQMWRQLTALVVFTSSQRPGPNRDGLKSLFN